MFEEILLPAAWPVYVSQVEAAAYARWRGQRLPTDMELGGGRINLDGNSYKYRREAIAELLEPHGFACRTHWIDQDALFMLGLFEAV